MLRIGISDCEKYDKYAAWIRKDERVKSIVRLGCKDQAIEMLDDCDGLLLTGGEDVHPKFYHQPELLSLCNADDMNEQRDEYELRLIERWKSISIPIFGICRGMQIFNIALGGTMKADLPYEGFYNHSKYGPDKDREHKIKLDPNSNFSRLLESSKGDINSAHHQAVDKIAAELVCCAQSPDLVCEALEWKNPEGKPFLFMVQWHPERMSMQESVFASGLRRIFINECIKASQQ
jgi:putative glutamine amidotransferase